MSLCETVAFRITEKQRETIATLISDGIFETQSLALRHLIDAGLSLAMIPVSDVERIDRLKETYAEVCATTITSNLIQSIRDALGDAMLRDAYEDVEEILQDAKTPPAHIKASWPNLLKSYMNTLRYDQVVRMAEAYVAAYVYIENETT